MVPDVEIGEGMYPENCKYWAERQGLFLSWQDIHTSNPPHAVTPRRREQRPDSGGQDGESRGTIQKLPISCQARGQQTLIATTLCADFNYLSHNPLTSHHCWHCYSFLLGSCDSLHEHTVSQGLDLITVNFQQINRPNPTKQIVSFFICKQTIGVLKTKIGKVVFKRLSSKMLSFLRK